MSLSSKVAANLPYLRRYARALTGSQESGDAFVRATLEAALADPGIKSSLAEGRVPLYRAFTQLWSAHADDAAAGASIAKGREGAAQAALSAVMPTSRQALLLTTLEEFSTAQAGEILGIDAAEVERLVAEAIAEIDREAATNVLIIEDEPLISMQLEDLVKSLGHDVFGTAATRTQAQEAIADAMPGLVLADIQLADGSSGLDAVDDILSIGDVPVIFITAYPERLLTGDRPEPTYLVTKPFQERVVRTAISQALFFKSNTASA
ncbi:response regulator [Altererythrobacter litoralis]|uniref:Response regulator n=1 Tax=Altererythrobacter litoralis TaxID=3113904 RepID=A0ABU7GGB9_9SPHN|nr:response regulator [Erythrobacteraceae bacterium 1XM1-14]